MVEKPGRCRDRSRVSFVSEAFERAGRCFRSVSLDFELSHKHPDGGASVHLQFDLPAEQDDPRLSEVFQRAHAVAREHLRRALALSDRKVSEDAFKDVVSRESHRVAHSLLSRAIELAERGQDPREAAPP